MGVRRRSSRFRWVVATAAPWALASGLLVSFTASAGQNVDFAWSTAPLTRIAAEVDPAGPGFITHAGGALAPLARLAHLGPDGFHAGRSIDPAVFENPPRAQAKARMSGTPNPVINRAAKADQLLSLKPTVGGRIRDGRSGGEMVGRLMFDAETETASIFAPGLEGAEWDRNAFVPLDQGEGATSRVAGSSSPQAAGGGGTSGASRPQIVSIDGATPATPKALALSSTTPAPAEATPVEIAAAPVSAPPGGASAIASLRKGGERSGTSLVDKAEPADTSRPSYAALIDPQAMSREQRCLAEAVYFEARSESEEGQAAVAQVVLNRVKSGLYPSTVCGVVYQNRHRHLACQFTFACEGKSLRITEQASWSQAVRVAREVTEGKTYLADVGGATHYHADYVRPYWAKRLKKMEVIGRHIFYKLKPGQT